MTRTSSLAISALLFGFVITATPGVTQNGESCVDCEGEFDNGFEDGGFDDGGFEGGNDDEGGLDITDGTPEPFADTPPVFIPPNLSQFDPRRRDPGGDGGSVSATVDDFIDGVQDLCARVPDPAYEIDCIAERLERLAASLPASSDFDEARSILRDASSQLNQVARENRDPDKRPAILRQDTATAPRRTSRPLIPVAPARQAAARSQAVAIVREAETQLLRAAERSERRRVAYTEIAAAVGETSLILLRAR